MADTDEEPDVLDQMKAGTDQVKPRLVGKTMTPQGVDEGRMRPGRPGRGVARPYGGDGDYSKGGIVKGVKHWPKSP